MVMGAQRARTLSPHPSASAAASDLDQAAAWIAHVLAASPAD